MSAHSSHLLACADNLTTKPNDLLQYTPESGEQNCHSYSSNSCLNTAFSAKSLCFFIKLYLLYFLVLCRKECHLLLHLSGFLPSDFAFLQLCHGAVFYSSYEY